MQEILLVIRGAIPLLDLKESCIGVFCIILDYCVLSFLCKVDVALLPQLLFIDMQHALCTFLLLCHMHLKVGRVFDKDGEG